MALGIQVDTMTAALCPAVAALLRHHPPFYYTWYMKPMITGGGAVVTSINSIVPFTLPVIPFPSPVSHNYYHSFLVLMILCINYLQDPVSLKGLS